MNKSKELLVRLADLKKLQTLKSNAGSDLKKASLIFYAAGLSQLAGHLKCGAWIRGFAGLGWTHTQGLGIKRRYFLYTEICQTFAWQYITPVEMTVPFFSLPARLQKRPIAPRRASTSR